MEQRVKPCPFSFPYNLMVSCPPHSVKWTIHLFSIEVTDTIRGEAADRIIIGRNAIYDGATPDLNPGDECIFFLTRYQDRGDYIVTSFQEGYYYIAADNRVYPVKLQDSTRAYSGMGLSEFKKEIRSYQYVEPDF